MVREDLSKLKIDQSVRTFRPVRRKKYVYLALFFLLITVTGFLYLNGFISPAVLVEVASVSQVYPSQTVSQLNASGYVVAQRKAAVASKITSQLVSLMVEEGSRVKEGQVIAVLENKDAMAARDQAEANLRVALANLEGLRQSWRMPPLHSIEIKSCGQEGSLQRRPMMSRKPVFSGQRQRWLQRRQP